jgi:putative glutamine transport system substrate-binding protein
LLCLISIHAPAAPRILRIQAVPIVNQGHFLEQMLATFAAQHGVTLAVTAQHGRAVVAAARAGTADLIIAHADFKGIVSLVQEGRVGPGRVVFANPIALLAPIGDPAQVVTAGSPEAALARITAAQACLVTNDLEHLRQFQADYLPGANCPVSTTAGTGLGAVLAGVSQQAYVWWGLHPFLMTNQPLQPVVFDDPRLLRPLMAWAVRGGDTALTDAAIDDLRGAVTQQRVAAFRFQLHPDLQVWWPFAAVDRLAAIRARGKLVVAVKNAGARAADAHRDPAHVAKRDFEIRLATALAKRLVGDPAKLTLRMMRKPQRLPAVAGGEVDIGIAMLRATTKSRSYTDFSQPYFEGGLAIMYRPDTPIDSPPALAGKRILSLARDAMGSDDEHAQFAAVAGASFKTFPVGNFKEAAAKIAAHEADGLVSQAANIDAFLAGVGSELKRSPILVGSEYAIAIPKDNPALRAIVDEEITRLRDSGELARWRASTGLALEAANPHNPERGTGQGNGGGNGQGAGRQRSD